MLNECRALTRQESEPALAREISVLIAKSRDDSGSATRGHHRPLRIRMRYWGNSLGCVALDRGYLGYFRLADGSGTPLKPLGVRAMIVTGPPRSRVHASEPHSCLTL